MAVQSGVPKQENGVWVGATDFSEFEVSTSLSTSVQYLGAAGDEPSIVGINNDITEGNYFYVRPATFSSIAFKYGVFDGLTAYGEMLARIYAPDPVGNRRTIGPVIQASYSTGDGRNWIHGGIYYRTADVDHESIVIRELNNNGGIMASADMQEAEQTGAAWYWARMRVQFSTTGSTGDGDHYRVKIWSGASSAEPSTWDRIQANAQSIRQVAGIGWGIEALTRQAQHRIAFLGFSEDPDVAAAPGPSDIIAGAAAAAEYQALLQWST